MLEDPEPYLFFIGVGLCLLILAFTSAADAAFTAIGRYRLNTLFSTETSHRTRAITRLMGDPYRFKATIILLNTVGVLTATAFTIALTARAEPWQRVAALVILLTLTLILGEVVPKALTMRNPTAAAARLAAPLNLLSSMLWPAIALLNFVSRPIFTLFSGQTAPPAPLVTEEELRLLVNVGEEEGLIEHDEREMIEGIFSFGDTLVREIMVPRVDIIGLELDTPFDTMLDLVIAQGHSRIPVYTENLDHIVGILFVKDLFPLLRENRREGTVRDVLREAYFVPETMKVNALLEALRKRKVHMAIVVDEYGGTAGVVTVEDLVEQIVGDIRDEYDTEEEPAIQEIGPGEFVVDATATLDDINAATDLNLVAIGDRIGGLVYEQLDRIPQVGDELMVDDAIITVLSVNGTRAQKLRIARRIEAAVNEQRDSERQGGGEHAAL